MNESSYLSYPQLILLLLLRLCLLLGHPDPLEVVPRGGVEELLAHVVVEALPHLETLSDTFFSRNENVKVVEWTTNSPMGRRKKTETGISGVSPRSETLSTEDRDPPSKISKIFLDNFTLQRSKMSRNTICLQTFLRLSCKRTALTAIQPCLCQFSDSFSGTLVSYNAILSDLMSFFDKILALLINQLAQIILK